jgi:hypothetical protein
VAYWTSQGITHFGLQWQNYKLPGVVEKEYVRNAFGQEYPVTIKSAPSVFRLAAQSTQKLYWSFAGDLQAVRPGSGSAISGLSLIRSSVKYAFQNTTMQALLVSNGSIASPLSWIHQCAYNTLGPFGSIDTFHTPAPPSLIAVYQAFNAYIHTLLATNGSATTAFKEIPAGGILYFRPTSWLASGTTMYSGNFLCGGSIGKPNIMSYINTRQACGNGNTNGEFITTYTFSMAMAMILSGAVDIANWASQSSQL